MFRLALIVFWVAPVSTGLAAGLVAALAPAAAPEVPAKNSKSKYSYLFLPVLTFLY
jgi:hypothetical protein